MRATMRGLVVVVLGLAVVAPVEAQLGGLMRRAKEAAEKKAVENDPRAPEASTSTQNPFADPAVVFITEDQLGRFEKALQYEIAQRNELRKALAAGKTREEYQACTMGVGTSPEMMKLIQDMADSSANASPEQAMKAQQKMSTDMQALLMKTCGPDLQQAQSGLAQRLRQIEAEASNIAMPPGYTPPAGAQGRLEERPVVNVAFSYRAPRPSFPSFEARRRAQAANAYPFARAYGMLKERVPVLCAKDAKVSAPSTITVGGQKMTVVKIQGQGQQYVFRQDEVDVLSKRCPSVMSLMNGLFDSEPK